MKEWQSGATEFGGLCQRRPSLYACWPPAKIDDSVEKLELLSQCAMILTGFQFVFQSASQNPIFAEYLPGCKSREGCDQYQKDRIEYELLCQQSFDPQHHDSF